MSYSIKVKVKITNPSWDKVLITFTRNVIIPLARLIGLAVHQFRKIKVSLNKSIDSLTKLILVAIAIPLGLGALAVLFWIPVVLFSVAMGWIK